MPGTPIASPTQIPVLRTPGPINLTMSTQLAADSEQRHLVLQGEPHRLVLFDTIIVPADKEIIFSVKDGMIELSWRYKK